VANNAKLGAILVNGAGMTLYTLSSEAGGVIKCSGGCLNVWPPVTLPAGVSAPTLGTGVTGAVGTITRPDGSVQVTYQGLPLYTFSRDKAPGDTNGNGIVAFGGTWRAAALQSVALSATPAVMLRIHISRISGSPAGHVKASFRLGSAREKVGCGEATCTLFVPRGDAVTLEVTRIVGRFAGWKIAGPGGTSILRGAKARLTMRSGVSATALFRSR
jgi:predicted lipoprotein with Yx(FWY)xxD motif